MDVVERVRRALAEVETGDLKTVPPLLKRAVSAALVRLIERGFRPSSKQETVDIALVLAETYKAGWSDRQRDG